MEIFIGIIILLIVFVLAKVYGISVNKIKEIIKKECNDQEIIQELKKIPNNTEVCKEILNEIENSNVEVVENKEYNASLYTVFNNRITIGKIQNEMFEVQTIAHECIHSTQNKRKTLFNFIISNIYILYFYFIIIGTVIIHIFNINNFILENQMLNITILLLLAFCQFSVRSLLETEAILEAKHLAKKYYEKKGIKTEVINKIIKEYDDTNKIGIDLMNYMLIVKSLSKVLIYIVLNLLLKFI